MDTRQAVIKACIAAAGGQVKLATRFGIKQQSVSGWVRRGYIPATRVREMINIARSKGIDAKEEQLNPTVFY